MLIGSILPSKINRGFITFPIFTIHFTILPSGKGINPLNLTRCLAPAPPSAEGRQDLPSAAGAHAESASQLAPDADGGGLEG